MLTEKEIELLKEFEKNAEQLIKMLDFHFNQIAQSPEFNKPGILSNIKILNDGIKFNLLTLQGYSFLLHSTAERGDIIELESLMQETTAPVDSWDNSIN